jgi:hypothetical protein
MGKNMETKVMKLVKNLNAIRRPAAIAGCLIVCATAQASFNISSLDTGATAIAGGTIDPNWTVSLLSGGSQPGPLTGSSYLVPNGTTYNVPEGGPSYQLVGPGPWIADDSTSSWISYYNPPTLPDESGDTMQYQLKFIADYTGALNIRWLSDNTSSIYLNGTLAGQKTDPNSAFSSWSTTSTLSLTSGTLYTVNLDVYNTPQGQPTWDNPTGGRVEFAGGAVSAVPEPTTIISGALLVLPFGASTLRILRKRQVA